MSGRCTGQLKTPSPLPVARRSGWRALTDRFCGEGGGRLIRGTIAQTINLNYSFSSGTVVGRRNDIEVPRTGEVKGLLPQVRKAFGFHCPYHCPRQKRPRVGRTLKPCYPRLDPAEGERRLLFTRQLPPL